MKLSPVTGDLFTLIKLQVVLEMLDEPHSKDSGWSSLLSSLLPMTETKPMTDLRFVCHNGLILR